MAGPRRFESALLRVKNLEESVKFYTKVMGLSEVMRDRNGIVYLACGLDEHPDMAIVEGGTGMDCFTMRVDTEKELEAYRAKLAERNVATDAGEDKEPNQKKWIRFKLPSSYVIEIAVIAERDYPRSQEPFIRSRPAHAPIDADHINYLAPDAKAELDFLNKVLGYAITDVKMTEKQDPNQWVWTGVRAGEYHHDIGLQPTWGDRESKLHHIAWTFTNMEHMTAMIDRVSQEGIMLELGPGRQPIGNISAYFWEPGGNRFELSTDMPMIPSGARTRYFWKREVFSWGGEFPKSFIKGS